MRWTRGHRSSNVEDRRGGGGGRVPLSIGAVVVALVGAYFGLDLSPLLGGGGGTGSQSKPIDPQNDSEREMVEFVSFVLDDVQDTWKKKFAEAGKPYRETRLVLYRQGTPTGCGYGSSAIGPFYCPGDQKVYIDLGFFRELDRRFGAPGDFAQAYVLAHEVGHHIQTVLGTDRKVAAMKRGKREAEANQLSVLQELQADCYAGIWGHSGSQRELLEKGDVAEGLRAAQAIGDDTLQKKSNRQVNPESFTHGSSEQRQRWLLRGLESGRLDDCDTFSSPEL